MNKAKLESQYNVKVDALHWEEHPNSKLFGFPIRTADVGRFCIYQEGDDYYVTRNGSVYKWIVDLGKEGGYK